MANTNCKKLFHWLFARALQSTPGEFGIDIGLDKMDLLVQQYVDL